MKIKTILLLSNILFVLNLSAQERVLTKEEMRTTIDSLSANLNRIYVFPDKAKEMSDLIRKNYEEGKYDLLTHPMRFSDRITEDLQSVSNDKHLHFAYGPERIKEMRSIRTEPEPDIDLMKEEMGQSNFGFEEVKILSGNIGYIKFNGFAEASLAGDAAAAAMNFVSYADAIIFDVRENGGGSPSMIQLLTSYLYSEGENIHLNNFYFRP